MVNRNLILFEGYQNMARGGKRPGAGRKPSSLTKKTRDIAEAAAAAGETPLEFLLRIMRDETQEPDVRRAMAVAAAAWCPVW